MARRKQSKPKVFTVDTPSEVDALSASALARDERNSPNFDGASGLVAAIWEAACRDQAYYEEEQRGRHERGEARRKRRRGGGKRVQSAVQTLEGDFEAAWFAVESTASARASVFMAVGVSKQEGAEASGSAAWKVSTRETSASGRSRGAGRSERVGGPGRVERVERVERFECVADGSGNVLLRGAGGGTYALRLEEELVGDVTLLLRSGVLGVVADGLDADNDVATVGLGVTDAGFSDGMPRGARQCLRRVLLAAQRASLECGELSSVPWRDRDLPQIVSASLGEDDAQDSELDASRLYELIKPTGDEDGYVDGDGRLSVLRPTLHGYQKRALRWMVDRENTAHFFDDQVGLWAKVEVLGGRGDENIESCFYVHRVSGALARQSEYRERVLLEAPRGGIACDEMGLGKTVEVLALVAANPRGSSDGCGVVTMEEGAAEDVKGVKKESNSLERGRGGDVRHALRILACPCGGEGRLKDEAEIPTGLLLVQCSRCGVYQHTHCVGLTSFSRSDDWKCAGCHAAEVLDMGLLDSKATLIVCPTPILSQWQSEIDKHVVPGTIRVVTYLGQEVAASSRPNGMVSPQELAAADVVLTTYDTLRKDLHRNPDKEAVRSLRYTKRYHAIPTPLTSIKFWRIVVDEAQMVESSTAKATEMVRKIEAVNRWAVTGTPISRGLEDLHGLFAFLGLTGIGWHDLIQRPLESGTYDQAYMCALSRLIKVLKPAVGGIMWRSSKKDVAHELRLPEQTACHNKLRFSNIERHFYDRQYQACCTQADKALSKSVGSRSSDPSDSINTRQLTKREERKLLLPLLRLRQACVHPQVGAGGLKSLSSVKTPMSMIEVLSVMVGKAKVEAEDAQRLLLSTINGLAGLEILRGRFGEAASRYRSVLKISRDNEGLIRMDKLQTLHTVYNLSQILNEHGVGRTLDDEALAASIEPLEKQYLGESSVRLEIAMSELKEVQKHADTVAKKFVRETGASKDLVGGWWVSAASMIVAQHERGTAVAARELVSKIKKELNEDQKYRRGAANAANLADRFKDLAGMQELLTLQLSGMEESRSTVMSLLEHLGKRVALQEAALVDTAAHCGTCRSFNATSGIVCEHCHFNKDMMAWEMRLFSLIATKYVTSYGSKKRNGGGIGDGDDGDDRDAGDGGEYGDDDGGYFGDGGGPGGDEMLPLAAEDVADHAHRRAMHRVGMGGLGESGVDIDGLGTNWQGDKRRSGRTGANKVSNSNVVRRPSQTEHMLRIILGVLRKTEYGGVGVCAKAEFEQERAILVKAAESHLAILEQRRKEYLKVGAVAMAQRQLLYALDELNMSRMRIKLRGEGQVLSAEEERYMVHPFEIPERIQEFENELVVSQTDLNKALGTLKYLKCLERLNLPVLKDGAAEVPAVAADPCPVCHDEIEDDMAMLPCGHILCVACNLKILERENRGRSSRAAVMKCPTCRSETPASETAVVTTNDNACTGDDLDMEGVVDHDPQLWRGEELLQVRGGYGTKLEAVVRRVMAIRDKMPDDRIIIFSTWQDALDIVAHALSQNDLPCLYPKTRKAFDQSISQFRVSSASTPKTARVLLLLIKQGGNGLNLQEAQHVVFLEPVMDPGEEAQAIGRVNRMGQRRQTFVHRFTIRDSVEENVCRMSAEKKRHESCKKKQKKGLSVGEVRQLLAG